MGFLEIKTAAEQGDAEAQFRLGECYYLGDGVEKNCDDALKWYGKAAEQGNARAQCVLGVCYAKGELVNKDYAEAVKWFHKAAMQGHTDAQYNLGTSYRKGEGVPLDNVKAYAWYNLAAKSKEAAVQARNLLEATMFPQQVTEGIYHTRELHIIIGAHRLRETGEADNKRQRRLPLTVLSQSSNTPKTSSIPVSISRMRSRRLPRAVRPRGWRHATHFIS